MEGVIGVSKRVAFEVYSAYTTVIIVLLQIIINVVSEENVKDFEEAFKWVKEVSTAAKGAFNFEQEILKEQGNTKAQKTFDYDPNAPKESFMLLNHKYIKLKHHIK
ncbi:hypothetical protein LCGC14_1432490 [marine sediment metagenome]|uniref:Uncharacterized protein n=1 Tax=marine sediment metagenome TaxID=412755 RepID=A0A0F9JN45_9ZZZZ